MRKGKVRIVNPLGLHARAAAQLVRLAEQFGSDIVLRRIDISASANARSIFSLLTLGAPVRSELSVEVSGEDESDAFEAVIQLFRTGFGEQ